MAGKKHSKKRFDYFDAFLRQAQLMREEGEIVSKTMESFSDKKLDKSLEQAKEVESAADGIVREILLSVDADFITPIEREDLIELAQEIDDITDGFQDVLKHLYMYGVGEVEPAAVEMCRLLNEEAALLGEALEDFRNFKKPKKLKEKAREIDELEDKIDDIFMDAMRALFNSGNGAEHIIKWRALYSVLEKCSDDMETVADLLKRIVIRNG